MADYPDSVYSPRTKENRSGVVYDAAKKSVIFVEDISKLDDEVVAIETELGANPKGAYASLVARLNALEAKSVFDSMIDYWNLYGTDGVGQTVMNDGLLSIDGGSAFMMTGSNIDDSVDIRAGEVYYKIAETGKALTVGFQLMGIDDITANTMWFGMLNGFSEPPGENADFVGFIIKNGSIYGKCGDGANKTETDTGIDLATGTQRTRLRFVFIPGTNCKFYVNDVLKATITTTLPDTEDMFPVMCIETLEAVNKSLNVGRVLIKKEY